MDILRSQYLKIKLFPPKIQAYYQSLQEDYKSVLKFLVEKCGMGYLVWENDNPIIVDPKLLSGELGELFDILKSGGLKANHCYGLFYEDKKSQVRPKKNSKVFEFVKSLAFLSEEQIQKESKKFDMVPPNQWIHYSSLLKEGDFEKLWENKIANEIGNPNKGVNLVSKVKNVFPKVKEPKNKAYCTALMSMIASSFPSWVECHKLHMAETATLNKKLEEKITTLGKVYADLLDFSNALENYNYGLSIKVLKKSLQYAKTNLGQEEYFAIPFAEIKKRPDLIAADEKLVFSAYKALKIYWRLRTRKKYISMPRMNDYQVPFGLTGRSMSFDLVSNGDITVTIGGEQIICCPSCYFNDLSVKKEQNKFVIKFRHKLKDKKKEVYGNWIEADLKEIKILKKEDYYYLYLPYTIHHPDNNFKLQSFFMAAEPQAKLLHENNKYQLIVPQKDKALKIYMLDSINVAGFDLNLSIPITATNAPYIDGIDPKTTVSQILCKDTCLSQQIRKLRNNFVKLIETIRSYKKALKNNIIMSQEDTDWLDSESGISGNRRYQLQTIIAKYKKDERELNYKCRKNGHNNLSENIRLLELMDAAFSLRKCYDNIHIFEQGKCVYVFSNERRENFRDFVSKQFGHIIAKHCQDTQVNVAFLEDLDFRGDFDDDTNALSRLFAAGQLKNAVQLALEKVGIGCVFVPYAGTSRTDPVTANFGYRDKQNKTNLFVVRNNKLGKIHSDLAASLNVLLVGLSHSIYPYKFWLNKEGVKDGKRLKTFLSKTKFNLPANYSGWVYTTPDGFCTEEQKKASVETIKQLTLITPDCQYFDINGSDVSCYKAFTVK